MRPTRGNAADLPGSCRFRRAGRPLGLSRPLAALVSCLAVVPLWTTAGAIAAEPPAAAAAETVVEIDTRFTVQGSLLATVNATAAAADTPTEAAVTTLEVEPHAVNADATIRYRQATSEGGRNAAGQTAVRQYLAAGAALEIAGQEVRQQLPAEARQVFWTEADGRLEPWLADGFVTRQERDLLSVPFDLWWQDVLSPPADSEAASWTLDPAGLARLLWIDTVESADVVATVDQIDANEVTVRFNGSVAGAVDGAATAIDVDGTYCWAAGGAAGPGVTRLKARIRERRQAGHAGPGLDVEAVVETTCRPAGGPVADLASSGQAGPEDDNGRDHGAEKRRPRRGPGRPGFLWLTDPRGRFDLVHDGRWRLIERQSGRTVLRLVDRGSLLAQATIVPLPPTADPPELEVFRRDIERSLEGQFNHVVSASESRRSDGTRLLRVSSAGEADDLPFRWIHYHLSHPEGGRASVSFMVEAGLVDRFAEADRRLVDGFSLAVSQLRPGDGPKLGQRQASRLTAPRRD